MTLVPENTSASTDGGRVRGREAELARIREAVHEVAGGRGGAVRIVGEPGSGKSRLLAFAAAAARERGVRVVRVRGGVSSTRSGAASLVAALAEGDDPLLDPAAAAAMDTSAHLRYWWVQEIGAALEASGTPVLVCVDDLQFCDPLTALAARTLPAGFPLAPVLWIVAQRSGSVTDRERQELGADVMPIGPLHPDAVVELVSDVLGGRPDEAVRAAISASPHLPVLAVSYATRLREQGGIVVDDDGTARFGDPASGARDGGDPVGARVRSLSPDARATAEAASVLGLQFSLRALAAVVGRPEGALVPPLLELVDRGFVHAAGPVLEFEHDVIRERIESGLDPDARGAARLRAIGAAIAGRDDPPAIARLALRIAADGGVDALPALERAIAAVADRDAEVAAGLILRRLELIPRDSPEFGAAAAEAVPVLWHAGLVEEARDLSIRRIESGLPPGEEAEARLTVAQLTSLDSPARARANVRAGLALTGVSEVVRARLAALEMRGLVFNRDFDGLAAALPAVRAHVEASADAVARSTLDHLEAIYRYYTFEWDEAADVVLRTWDASLKHAETWFGAVVRVALLRSTGRLDEALSTSEREIAAADAQRQTIALFHHQLLLSNLLLDLGRLQEAQILAESVIDMARDIGAEWTVEVGAVSVLAQIAVYREEPDAQQRFGPLAAKFTADGVAHQSRGGEWIQLLLADLAGDTAAIERLTRGEYDRSRMLVPPVGGASDVADDVYFVRLALSVGERDRAQAVAALAALRVTRTGTVVAATVHAHVRGLLEASPARLRDAVDGYRMLGRPLNQAWALEDLASLLAVDRPEEARSLLGRAHRLASASDATRALARIESRIRDIGGRPPARTSTRNELGLTPAEERIVERAVLNETTAEIAAALFLSQNTVTAHLRRIYATLGVRSRAEMIGVVRASRAGRAARP